MRLAQEDAHGLAAGLAELERPFVDVQPDEFIRKIAGHVAREAQGVGDRLLSMREGVIDRLPQLGARAAHVKQALMDKLVDHKGYITQYGQDLPEIRDWKWGAQQ